MRIDIAGFGPGDVSMCTGEVLEAIEKADLIITSEGIADVLKKGISLREGTVVLTAAKSRVICRILEERAYDRALCLFRGDISIYSGAAPLMKLIRQSAVLNDGRHEVKLFPGISSPSCACARLGLSSREVAVFSAHGRECDPVRAVMCGRKSLFLTSGREGVPILCEELVRAGLGDLKVTVLEMLGYPDERIRTMKAAEASRMKFGPLSIMAAEPARVSEFLRRRVPGIPDDAFIRGRVPMTKRFVRVSALAMLDPSGNDICWDLGAGTGGMSIELSAHCQRVVCVERDPEALDLLEKNRERFGAWNMEIVRGEIPHSLESLPAPDRIFIGGGGRCIRAVLESAEAKCKGEKPVICASAVTLETLHEVSRALTEYGYGTHIVQVAVTDVVKRGDVNMMSAQNPVFLIAGTGHEAASAEPMTES